MPDVLAALIAFVAEHQRCGDLEGGLEDGVVWFKCSCTARLARRAAPPVDQARRLDGPGGSGPSPR
jgi:hypothetical protein